LDNAGGMVLAVVIVAAVIVGLIISARLRRQRTEALARFAYERGWAFDPGPHDAGGGLFSGPSRTDGFPYAIFSLFQAGHAREFANTMSGSLDTGSSGIGAGCEAGDYQWVTGSGKNRRTHERSYLLFNMTADLGGTPTLVIRPEGLGDRIMDMLGGGDIDFESEEFSRRFHVSSSDRRFAFAVIDPRMMEFLLAHPDRNLQLNAGVGLLVSGHGHWEPDDFASAAGWVKGFLEHWPAYLVKQCRDAAR